MSELPSSERASPSLCGTKKQPALYGCDNLSLNGEGFDAYPQLPLIPPRRRSESDSSFVAPKPRILPASPSLPQLLPMAPGQHMSYVYHQSPLSLPAYQATPISGGSSSPPQQQSLTSPLDWSGFFDNQSVNPGYPVPSYAPMAHPGTVYAQEAHPPSAGTLSGAPPSSLAGSLDPATGIFYRAQGLPRLRTIQACEKCRSRKAKVIEPFYNLCMGRF
jgi:hypothetical protein